MNRSSKSFRLCLLVLPLLFAFGCSDDDNPTVPPPDPPGDTGSIEDLMANLLFIQDTYLTPNEEVGDVIFYFLPRASALVSLSSSFPTSGGTVSCFDPSVIGVTYDFDGLMYVETTQSGAPTDGVRFITYPIDEMTEEPILGTPNGHMDLTCDSDLVETTATFSVVMDGFEVIQLTTTVDNMSPVARTLSGTINAVGVSAPLDFRGTATTPSVTNPHLAMIYTVSSLPGFDASSFWQESLSQSELNESYEVNLNEQSNSYDLGIDMTADLAGAIIEGRGFVLYSINNDDYHVGCASGILEDPLFQNATDGGCLTEGVTIMDATPAELDAIYDGHEILHGLHEFFSFLVSLEEQPASISGF